MAAVATRQRGLAPIEAQAGFRPLGPVAAVAAISQQGRDIALEFDLGVLVRRGRHGGWGWRGFGWGFAPGFAIGFGAPYYGGFYGGPYYAYGGDCVMRRRWVINRWGHRVLRWTRVCY